MTKENHTHLEIGKTYFVRTVTMHIVGKLTSINDSEFMFSPACWVADSGRFHKALSEGILKEYEPFVNPAIVGRGGLIDATEWTHKIPRTVTAKE